MVSIIKRYQLSNGKIQKNFMQILSTFTWMCNKCTTFNFWSMCCAVSKIVLRHLITNFLYKTMVYISDNVKERHWLELYCSSTSRESLVVLAEALGLRNTLLSVCLSVVEVHPAKSAIFLLALCCLKLWSLITVVKQFQWLYGMPFLRKSYLYSTLLLSNARC